MLAAMRRPLSHAGVRHLAIPPLGQVGSAARVVDTSISAATLGSGALDVFGTPAMVALMEQASCDCVGSFLEAGETTVGTKVDIVHL